MIFSIIIPTLNESESIASCMRSIIKNSRSKDKGSDIEVIISDGGSKDDTLEIASRFENKIKLKIIHLEKAGLPEQLNKGASVAAGNALIFLHADCRLSSDGLEKIENTFNRFPGLVGGAFTMKVEGERFFYNILSAGGNFYCKIKKIFFGDRAIFVRRNVFNELSGFRDLAFMSDFDFSKRMKREGKVNLLKGPVVSSGRKFEKEPFYRIIYLTFWSLAAFDLGIDTGIIKKRYYGHKK